MTARGGSPAATSRTIVTTIYYPTTVQPSSANPTPVHVPGPLPLIVFAHGYEIDAAAYAPLLEDLAAGGFVVAAPDFPGTSTRYTGGAIRSDSLEEPADISFVITSMIINHRYQGAKWSLTIIDGGYLFGVLLVQGLVIGLFG